MNIGFAVFLTLYTLLRKVSPLKRVSRDAWCGLVRCGMVFWAASVIWRSTILCGDNIHHLMFGRGRDNCLPADVVHYTAAVLAFYVFEIVDLVSTKQRRTDDTVLLLHHAVTVLLCGLWGLRAQMYWAAMWFNAAHEISDIFLESAKVLRRQESNSLAHRASEHLFTLFAVSWFALRVYYIPFCYLPAALADRNRHSIPYSNCLLTLVGALQMAQAYWTGLIVRAVWRQYASDGQLVDERETEDRDR